MPSLVYISRLTQTSQDLVQDLQSAGLHIKSFAPGEITADECILVMTSEAVLASIRPANGAAPTAGHVRGLEGVSPPPNANGYLESQSATWNKLNSSAAKESATGGEQLSSIASKINSRTEDRGSSAREVGSRVLATSAKSAETSQPLAVAPANPSVKSANPSLPPASLPSGEQSRIRPARTSATLFGMALRFGRRSRLNGPRYKLFWQTVAIAASLLIFAALRPSTTDVTTGDTTQSTRLDVVSKELRSTGSETRSQQPEVSRAAAGQLRQPDHFVAKDFTNHFKLRANSIATMEKSELKRDAQGSVSHKRAVVN